jgi:[CysO sulfur-carrier protein]-S-L-cysteine hydrolase
MLKMSVSQLDQITLYAASASPLEVCGLMAGINNSVQLIYPIVNVAPDPEGAFLMERREQIRAMLQIDRMHLDLLAIYHSHPPGRPAWPSATDIAEATYPDVVSIILARAADGAWSPGAFKMRDGRVFESTLQIGKYEGSNL